MATTKQPFKSSAPPQPAPVNRSNTFFLFDRMNYYIIGGGVLMLIVGYLLMAGGKQPLESFNPDEIYSFRRVTLAPIVVVLGYAVIAYGIMKKPAHQN